MTVWHGQPKNLDMMIIIIMIGYDNSNYYYNKARMAKIEASCCSCVKWLLSSKFALKVPFCDQPNDIQRTQLFMDHKMHLTSGIVFILFLEIGSPIKQQKCVITGRICCLQILDQLDIKKIYSTSIVCENELILRNFYCQRRIVYELILFLVCCWHR